MSDYVPIDCALYSRYELAILHRERLRVVWRNGDNTCHLETLLPVDLQTHNHAEYLLAKTDGGGARKLRLDQIVRVEFNI